MSVTREEIQKQMESIKKEREEYLQRVNRQLGGYEGAIQSLELLLESSNGKLEADVLDEGAPSAEPPDGEAGRRTRR